MRVTLEEPVCAEAYADLQQLGRFVMREEGMTSAVGVIISLGGDSDDEEDEQAAEGQEN